MPIRLSPSLLLPAVLVAAVAGYLVADRSSSAASPPAETAAAEQAATPPPAGSAALPPDHPLIGGSGAMAGMGGHGGHGGTGGTTTAGSPEPAALSWAAPTGWQTMPNPSPMRLATYKVGEGAEVSVARAGGTVDMNVQRWTQQFDGTPKVDRGERRINGLKITIVHIVGTFLGAGMTPTAPPDKRDGWAMTAAVVESTGTPYFFKLLGPAEQVDRARAGFDALVGSINPSAAPNQAP